MTKSHGAEFDPTSMFTSQPDAARYLGKPYKTFAEGTPDTLCLHEKKVKQGGRYVFVTAALVRHADMVVVRDRCDGSCKDVAEMIIRECRDRIERQSSAASGLSPKGRKAKRDDRQTD